MKKDSFFLFSVEDSKSQRDQSVSKFDIALTLWQIRANETERDEVIVSLFNSEELRSSFAILLKKYQGTFLEVDMLLGDSIIAFIKTVLKNRSLQIKKSVEAYLYGIANNVLLQELRKNRPDTSKFPLPPGWDNSLGDTPEDLVINTEQKDLIQKLLKVVGDRCKEILQLWAAKYSMQEIADKIGYDNPGVAKTQRYKCFVRLRNYLGKHPEIKKILR